jgi:hypothetical protein
MLKLLLRKPDDFAFKKRPFVGERTANLVESDKLERAGKKMLPRLHQRRQFVFERVIRIVTVWLRSLFCVAGTSVALLRQNGRSRVVVSRMDRHRLGFLRKQGRDRPHHGSTNSHLSAPCPSGQQQLRWLAPKAAYPR